MTVPEQIYTAAKSVGFTTEGACALLAQIQEESAFRANNVEDRSGIPDEVYTAQVDNGLRSRDQFMRDSYGYGYAQWTYPTRKALMYDFFKNQGKSIGDSDTQITFLFWEMQHYFLNQWNLCRSSNDLYKCTWDLLNVWENPAEKTNNMARRYENAKKFLAYFQSWNGLSGEQTTDKECFNNEKAHLNVPVQSNLETADDSGLFHSLQIRVIDENMEGPDVKLAQAALNCWGYVIVVTGIFGKEMTKKVMDFQQRNGLATDGVIGRNTWKKLLEVKL